MNALNASNLLRIWEQAASHPPGRRSSLLLLGAISNPEAAADMSIGQRDRLLMLLRRELFGDRIEGITECPSCGERVEVSFDLTRILHGDMESVPPAAVLVQGYEVHWRLPTCVEVSELATETSPQRLRQLMLDRCLMEIRHEGEPIEPVKCPDAVIEDVCKAMAQADPWSDIRLDVDCPQCGTSWKCDFDIGGFLWCEVDAWARRLLREIHCLASALGWSEREILALSARRRAMYLDLVGA